MYEVKEIGPVSLAKFQAVIAGLSAAVFGLPILVLEAAVPGAGIGSYLGLLLFSVVGAFIGGVIIAVIYNVLAGLIGGITLNLEDHSTSPE